jgi:hypothetical protein
MVMGMATDHIVTDMVVDMIAGMGIGANVVQEVVVIPTIRVVRKYEKPYLFLPISPKILPIQDRRVSQLVDTQTKNDSRYPHLLSQAIYLRFRLLVEIFSITSIPVVV